MTVLDANILLYAYQVLSPFHSRARVWLEGVLSSGQPVGLPWQSAGAFLRVAADGNWEDAVYKRFVDGGKAAIRLLKEEQT